MKRSFVKSRGSGSNRPARYLSRTSIAPGEEFDRIPEPSFAGVFQALEEGAAGQAEREIEYDQSEVPSSASATTLLPDATRNIIATNQSPDIPFSQSINPYKGCEHGCVYCYARPTHAYLDLSPGLDFEQRIFFKTNVAESLDHALTRKNYQCSTIAMGTNTDPYQPAEKRLRITRLVLERMLAYKHPVSIVTKSQLVLRDLDLLVPLAQQGLVTVNLSVTTLNDHLKGKLEPRTANGSARLRAVRSLADHGVPVGVMVAPVIPFVNDEELENIVSASADAGAQMVRYILLRLPQEVEGLFVEWLQYHYPDRAKRVMSAIKSARQGKAYRSEWHTRMVGEGPVAQLIAQRFKAAVTRHGLHQAELPALRTDLFNPQVFEPQQSLF